MHLRLFIPAIVASCAVTAAANPAFGNNLHCTVGKSPPESSRCYTKVARTRPQGNFQTTWHTHTEPCTVTASCTTTVTSTPTTSVTVTSTSTVTSSTTSTVPAPATFTPVQSSIPGSTYSGSGGSDPVDKRDLLDRSTNPHSQQLIFGSRYPQNCWCQAWIPAKCHTTSTTCTSTVYAPTSTELATTTTTTTSYTTVATVYAACATNNLADKYLGQPFGEVSGGFASVFDVNTTTAYDCCVAAVTLADTSVFAFEPNPFAGEGANCFIGQTGGTCPAPATNPSTADSGFGDLVIGNSYCGQIDADVPVGSAKAKRWAPAPTPF